LRILGDDGEGWDCPSEEYVRGLISFVAGDFKGAPARSWRSAVGRFGWNREGVFLHESHRERFFGICRASASFVLRKAVPEALPSFTTPGKVGEGVAGSDKILGALMTHLPSISDDLRKQVLLSTFKRADINKNGTLSRPEVGTMFRRVVNTMSASDIEEIMQDADKDSSGSINYSEFVAWLETSAPDKVTRGLRKAMSTEADAVKAAFRVWDRNGDGLVSRRELEKALNKMVKGFSPVQVTSLCDLLDADHDGNVDYNEFVDFLFHSFKSNK